MCGADPGADLRENRPNHIYIYIYIYTAHTPRADPYINEVQVQHADRTVFKPRRRTRPGAGPGAYPAHSHLY